MPDTPRTLAALQALLADNTTGDISPQDIRDFLVSVFPNDDNDHALYALLAGRASGQTIRGGSVGGVNLAFQSNPVGDGAISSGLSNAHTFSTIIQLGVADEIITAGRISLAATRRSAIRAIAESGTADNLASVQIPAGLAEGPLLVVYATTGHTITIKHDDSGEGLAGFRFDLNGGADLVLSPLSDAAFFIYSNLALSGVGGWIEIGARHALVTLAADADTILALAGQELGLDTQSANRVLAGPTSGGAAGPTFRALVDADIPAAIARDAEVTSEIATHAGAADPHPDYTLSTELASHAAAADAHPDHTDAVHTGKIGEVPWGPRLITLTKALPGATNNATLDDDWVYKSPWTNEAVRINNWYIRFQSALAAAATFELRKNGTVITGSSIVIAAAARDAAIDAFTETTLADGDSLEVWQTAGNAEDIGGSAYVYGDQDVVATVTY